MPTLNNIWRPKCDFIQHSFLVTNAQYLDLIGILHLHTSQLVFFVYQVYVAQGLYWIYEAHGSRSCLAYVDWDAYGKLHATTSNDSTTNVDYTQ